ncbi:hypothetical protein ABPG75_009209 [Micractinium tetrahymenae]
MRRALALLACGALLWCSGAAAFPSLGDIAQGATDIAQEATDAAAGVVGAVTSAVDDALSAAEQAGSRAWDSVVDLIDSKNGTERLWEAVQAAVDAGTIDVGELQDGTWTGTVFAPLSSAFDDAEVEDALTDPSLLAQVLSYHIIAGEALTLEQLQAMDGQLLQSTLEGDTGELKVRNTGLKAALLTTSGQEAAIYQYNLKAGNAIVHTVKAVLIPGNETLEADAALSPAAAPAEAPAPPPPSPVPSPSPPPPSPPKGPCTYTVQSGDFLYGIADKLKVSADELLALNPQFKERPESIPLGAKLIVPC